MKYYIFIFIFIFCSCNSKYSQNDKDFKACLNSMVNNPRIETLGTKSEIDIFKYVLEVESKIFNKKNSSITKEDYIKLINNISSNDRRSNSNLSNEFENKFNNYEIDISESLRDLSIYYFNCPGKNITQNSTNYDVLKLQSEIIHNAEKGNDNFNLDTIINWINEIEDQEFDKIIYRTPILLIIRGYLIINNN